MKTKEIKTNLRTIKVGYRTEGELSTFEKTAISDYKRLHNRLYKFDRKYREMNGLLLQLELIQEELVEDLVSLEQSVKKAGPLAGYDIKELIEEGVTEWNIDTNAINAETLRLRDKVDAHHSLLNTLYIDSEKWNTAFETLDVQYKFFDKYQFFVIIRDWEKMVIDTVVFDEDFEEFQAIFHELENKKRVIFHANWQSFVIKRNLYLQELNAMYRRVEGLNKQIEEITERAGREGFSLN